MSEHLRLAIVGCGGMGNRHLLGLAELQQIGLSPFELAGVCDPDLENACSQTAPDVLLILGRSRWGTADAFRPFKSRRSQVVSGQEQVLGTGFPVDADSAALRLLNLRHCRIA